MTVSMHQISVPVFVRMLGNLSKLLDKGVASAEARKFDPQVLVTSRLAPDMHPLSRQVQIACDVSKGCVARLAGVEPPSHPDAETTIDELKVRIAKTIAFIETVTPEQLDGSETRTVTMKAGPNDLTFKGLDYLLGFGLANLHFHTTTAYAILRHNGVDVGKLDYLGPIQ